MTEPGGLFGWSPRSPTRWGAGGRSSAVFGPGVIDDFIDGLRAFIDHSTGHGNRPVAIGAVGWLTHKTIIAQLGRITSCVAINKPKSRTRALDQLASLGDETTRLWPDALPVVGLYAGPTRDGKAPTMNSDGTIDGDREPFEKVRVIGYRPEAGVTSPLVHGKVIVLGHQRWQYADVPGYGEHRWLDWQTEAVWVGSANWTSNAARSLDFGIWTDDPDLCSAAAIYVGEVLARSEPYGSTATTPSSDLQPVVDLDWEPDEDDLAYLAERDRLDDGDAFDSEHFDPY